MTAGVAVAVAGVSLALAPASLAVDFTVTQTSDESDANLADDPNVCDVSADAGDQCTLRAAIEESNATAGFDQILFNIPGETVHTFVPATVYPDLTSPVFINGYSQPGASANTQPFGKALDSVLLIEIDGTSLPNAEIENGLTLAAGATNSSIRGLVINNVTPSAGIEFHGADSCTIAGNYLGTNPAGTAAEPNGDGIFGFSGGGTLIGGGSADNRNLISGNARDAVSTNIPFTVEGNHIGVAADAKTPLPNVRHGLSLFSLIESEIGGPGQEANLIANNGGNAVELVNPTSGTLITGNRIHDNGGLGIDLNQDGVTPNDDDDADGGPNELQNYPVLQSALNRPAATKVRGTLNSVPEGEYTLEFFWNKAKERQGRRPIGTETVGTDLDGDASFRFKPATKVKLGRFITATATNANDSTSEFSKPRKVTKP